MTLAEALKTGGLVRRPSFAVFGTVIEVGAVGSKVVFCYNETRTADADGSSESELRTINLTLTDILADDWEVKEELKEYWVGVIDIQQPTSTLRIIRAVEQAEMPLTRTADGKPWIKVRQVE